MYWMHVCMFCIDLDVLILHQQFISLRLKLSLRLLVFLYQPIFNIYVNINLTLNLLRKDRLKMFRLLNH